MIWRFCASGRAGRRMRALPGLVGYFLAREGGATSSSAAHGATVSAWADLSPRAADAVQATEADRPTLDYLTCPGGRAIRFQDGRHLRAAAPASATKSVVVAFVTRAGSGTHQVAVTQDTSATTDKPAWEAQIG